MSTQQEIWHCGTEGATTEQRKEPFVYVLRLPMAIDYGRNQDCYQWEGDERSQCLTNFTQKRSLYIILKIYD